MAMRLPEALDLHVAGRLSEADARRQYRSATEILRRFAHQPGVILGDEVGMGKTFVALAVASAFVAEDDQRPVVVMAPAGVVRKWRRDAVTFRAECLRDESTRDRLRVGTAETGIEFLKLLDDPPERRASLIVLPHGAFHRAMSDSWIRLAVLQAAIRGRHGVDDLRNRLARFAPSILRLKGRATEALVRRLLSAPPTDWKRLLVDEGQLDAHADDPVPRLLVDTLGDIDLQPVYERVIEVLPVRASANIEERLKDARHALNSASDGVLPPVWRQLLGRMKLVLPLLVLDEAHRVRNGSANLAQLLREQQANLEEANGALANRFERMLFLTATPFQLGHAELCNVLSRFSAVAWSHARAPSMGRAAFTGELEALKHALDHMQHAATRLETAWKRVRAPDIEEARALGESWWSRGEVGLPRGAVANDRLQGVMTAFTESRTAIADAEGRLRPWVLRSARPGFFPPPHDRVPRRERLEGAAVLGELGEPGRPGGLRVSAVNALPFLLAARIGTLRADGRYFGEGLASSYEALLDTRRDASEPPDAAAGATTGRSFHEQRLRAAVRALDASGRRMHPKVRATVDLAMKLWRDGEKVVVFCHYRETGRALHRYLSDAMLDEIQGRAAAALRCAPEAVDAHMARFVDRLARDRAGGLLAEIDVLLRDFPALQRAEVRHSLQDVVLRFMRTPSFLVRYADLGVERIPQDWAARMLERCDASGLTLRRMLVRFFDFLAHRCGDQERDAYLGALKSIQTGTHAGGEADAAFAGDELPPGERARLVANVRRVFGETRDETRDRIMLAFNTPFYPEILVASRVMSEGVDLHLNCRHVIHHDLDWNPSSLEQRTGRIDRLGSKAESTGRPIRIYLPYVEGCQDEKLFRVVMDRERWFEVVMGADESLQRLLSAGPWEVERLVDQPAVPSALVESLRLRLDPP